MCVLFEIAAIILVCQHSHTLFNAIAEFVWVQVSNIAAGVYEGMVVRFDWI